MIMVKICGIVFVCLFAAIIIKCIKPEYAFMPVIAGVLAIIFLFMDGSISSTFDAIKDVAEETEIEEYIAILLKAVGISYIAVITADICRSAGEEMLANIAQTAAKLEILALCFPLAMQLIETAREML